MKRTLILMKKVSTQLIAWAGVAMLCVVPALPQDGSAAPGQSQDQPAAQGQRTDGQIEMDVVHTLDASAALKNDLITAATIQGEVTLSGTVSSDASKQLAESIVAHVDGVTKVHNNLQVGNPAQAAQTSQPNPAPDSQEMPDADQSQAQQGMAGLPPPGPTPDQNQAPPPQPQASAPNYPQGQPYPPSQQYPQGYPPQGYPQQGGYPPPPPPRPQYQNPQNSQYPPAPPASRFQTAGGPITMSPGTVLQLRTTESIESKHAKDGEPIEFTVIQDVGVNGYLAIPRGATVHGVVAEVKNVGSGDLGGSSQLGLKLTSLDLGGRSYPIDSNMFKVKAPNKAGQTVGSAVGGAIIGTIIGCAVGRGAGCAIGAGAGAVGGTAAGAAAPGPRAWIPAEALVTFRLNSPLTVDPVSQQEAQRLAQGLYPGGPTLYRRYPYGSPYYGYGPGYYAYPAPYYVPYYMVGGVYYWR